jgi:hypothetical protein
VTGAEGRDVAADEWAEAWRLADMLADRADRMAADGYAVLAGHLRADARQLRADAWRAVGYG